MFGMLKGLFQKKDKSIVAIVTIEREPRLITKDRVESICRTLAINGVITEERSSYIRIETNGWHYVVFSSPLPYKPFMGINFKDARMNQMSADHRGYFATECLKCPAGEDRKSSRRILAKMTSLIIDEQSLAIYDWTSARYAVMNSEVAEHLAEGDTDAAVNAYSDLVVGVGGEQLEEAIAEARRRWPEFCSAFEAATDKSSFVVKAAFRRDDDTEHMWIEPRLTHLDRVEGILQSTPVHMPSPRKGDHVERKLEDISDWGYVNEQGKPVGMFTMEIVRDAIHKD